MPRDNTLTAPALPDFSNAMDELTKLMALPADQQVAAWNAKTEQVLQQVKETIPFDVLPELLDTMRSLVTDIAYIQGAVNHSSHDDRLITDLMRFVAHENSLIERIGTLERIQTAVDLATQDEIVKFKTDSGDKLRDFVSLILSYKKAINDAITSGNSNQLVALVGSSPDYAELIISRPKQTGRPRGLDPLSISIRQLIIAKKQSTASHLTDQRAAEMVYGELLSIAAPNLEQIEVIKWFQDREHRRWGKEVNKFINKKISRN